MGSLNRLRMYGNGLFQAIVLDHRSTATSLTGIFVLSGYLFLIHSGSKILSRYRR